MHTIKAECGAIIREGDRAYNYYEMKPGAIVAGSVDEAEWFRFRHDDGSFALLNGARICSMTYARRRGFPGATNA